MARGRRAALPACRLSCLHRCAAGQPACPPAPPTDEGFGVGHTRLTQTKGVWMWGEPTEVTLPDGTTTNVRRACACWWRQSRGTTCGGGAADDLVCEGGRRFAGAGARAGTGQAGVRSSLDRFPAGLHPDCAPPMSRSRLCVCSCCSSTRKALRARAKRIRTTTEYLRCPP